MIVLVKIWDNNVSSPLLISTCIYQFEIASISRLVTEMSIVIATASQLVIATPLIKYNSSVPRVAVTFYISKRTGTMSLVISCC